MHCERRAGAPVASIFVLVERGLRRSRARAQDLIRRGLVEVAGVVETRPGAARRRRRRRSACRAAPAAHVSRGALEADRRPRSFPVSRSTDVVALDIGASTGGFTQVLLERGAARVYAVDVGHGQLHARLAADPRVVSLEGCDARRLDRALVPEPVGAIVADVSFISLTKALPAPLALAPARSLAGGADQAAVRGGTRGRRQAAASCAMPAARQRAVALVRDWIAGAAGLARARRHRLADRRRLGQRGVPAGGDAWRLKRTRSRSSGSARKATASPSCRTAAALRSLRAAGRAVARGRRRAADACCARIRRGPTRSAGISAAAAAASPSTCPTRSMPTGSAASSSRPSAIAASTRRSTTCSACRSPAGAASRSMPGATARTCTSASIAPRRTTS